MSYPILYRSDDVDLLKGIVPKHHGIGTLTRINSPVVSEERQAAFTLEFDYYAPTETDEDYNIQKVIFDELVKHNVVKAKPNDFDGDRLFRIEDVEFDTINNSKKVTATVIAQADLTANAFQKVDITTTTPSNAFKTMVEKAVVPTPYTAWTDITETSNFTQEYNNVLNAIAGSEGSIIDTWRTEIEWDNFTVRFWKNRGKNRDVRIAYKKNLTGLNMTTTGDITTRIIPFAKIDNGDGTTREITLSEVVIDAENVGEFFQPLALPVDFSQEMQDAGYTSEAQLRTLAKEWFEKTGNNQPKVNIEVNFVQLARTEEYKDYAALECIALFDTVQVWHDEWGIYLDARVSKYQYDPVEELYLSMELGDAKYSLSSRATSDAEMKQQLENKFNNIHDFINLAIDKATQLITGNDGGYVVLYPPGRPAEIFIMDTDDMNTAKQVLRLNKSGIGFSSDGVNGPYKSAWTLDGAFNADFITAGTIQAIDIKGVNITGSKIQADEFSAIVDKMVPNPSGGNWIKQGEGRFTVNGDSLVFELRNASGTIIGKLIMDYGGYYILDNQGRQVGGVSDEVVTSHAISVPPYDRQGWGLAGFYIGVDTTSSGELRIVDKKGLPNSGADPNNYTYGNVRAKSFIQHSSEKAKSDIKPIEDAEFFITSAVEMIMSTGLFEYRYGDDGALQIGFIAEQTPRPLLAEDGKGIDIYKAVAYLWRYAQEAIKKNQQLENKLNDIEERLEKLERGGADGTS